MPGCNLHHLTEHDPTQPFGAVRHCSLYPSPSSTILDEHRRGHRCAPHSVGGFGTVTEGKLRTTLLRSSSAHISPSSDRHLGRPPKVLPGVPSTRKIGTNSRSRAPSSSLGASLAASSTSSSGWSSYSPASFFFSPATAFGRPGSDVTVWVYRAVAGLLAALAVLTALTGARTGVIWFKVCPILLGSAAALLLVASFI